MFGVYPILPQKLLYFGMNMALYIIVPFRLGVSNTICLFHEEKKKNTDKPSPTS